LLITIETLPDKDLVDLNSLLRSYLGLVSQESSLQPNSPFLSLAEKSMIVYTGLSMRLPLSKALPISIKDRID
jgi:hypothetical protein